jgi:hypothetical protein
MRQNRSGYVISIEYISRVKVFDRNLFPAVQAAYIAS